MAARKYELNVRDHGTSVLISGNKRAKCKYCGKDVSGFNRLEKHLGGGVKGDVGPCPAVPGPVKEQFQIQILKKKEESMKKEVGDSAHPNLRLNMHDSITRGKKRAREISSAEITIRNGPVRIFQDFPSSTIIEESDEVKRSIEESNRFHSLTATLASLGKRDTRISIQCFGTLRSLISPEERKEMDIQLEKKRSSWRITGCSILVDGWRDARGHNLIDILVDCPEGPVYLRSFDITAAGGSVDAMMLIFNEAILEVGEANVVQIILSSTFPGMLDAAKVLMRKHKTISWAISSTRCIELMLEEIGKMDQTSSILSIAGNLVQLIYSNQTVLHLVRSYTRVIDLVMDTRVSSTLPFSTLEKIVSEKESLQKMVDSPEWISLVGSSHYEGRRLSTLLRDPSFWHGANLVLKATIPLVHALEFIQKYPEPQLGFIYETIDQAKERIREGLNDNADLYMPYWIALDEIWNKCLHHPLHSAGYFLNPRFRYSTYFCADEEVSLGTFKCIFTMVEEENIRNLIIEQLLRYRKAEGAFGQDAAAELSSKMSPVCWWSRFGGECPELQQFAKRILSQTCDGSEKYNLDRSSAEKLHAEGRSVIEKLILEEQTYVQYYFQLDSFVKRCRTGECSIPRACVPQVI